MPFVYSLVPDKKERNAFCFLMVYSSLVVPNLLLQSTTEYIYTLQCGSQLVTRCNPLIYIYACHNIISSILFRFCLAQQKKYYCWVDDCGGGESGVASSFVLLLFAILCGM